MELVEVKKYPMAIFRICRREDIEKIGFGEPQYYETEAFCKNLIKYGLKAARPRKVDMCATQFSAKNKGYPKEFKSRTYREARDYKS